MAVMWNDKSVRLENVDCVNRRIPRLQVLGGLQNGGNAVVVSGNLVLNEFDTGTTYIVTRAAVTEIHLPGVKSGLNFRFINKVNRTANLNITRRAGDGDVIIGVVNDGAVLDRATGRAGSVFHQARLDATSDVGDWLEFFCDGNHWIVRGETGTAASFSFVT